MDRLCTSGAWIDFKVAHEHLLVRGRPHPYEVTLYSDVWRGRE